MNDARPCGTPVPGTLALSGVKKVTLCPTFDGLSELRLFKNVPPVFSKTVTLHLRRSFECPSFGVSLSPGHQKNEVTAGPQPHLPTHPDAVQQAFPTVFPVK